MRARLLSCAVVTVVGALSACEAEEHANAVAREAASSVVEPAPAVEAPVDTVPQGPAEETAPSPTPERTVEAQAPAPVAKSPPSSFRDGVLAEMQTVLGRPVRTRQDALNATYQKIGWRPGAAPTERQNRDAYHQAMAWGFTVGRLARGGRDQALATEDVAEQPLQESDLTVLDGTREDDDAVAQAQGALRGQTLPLVNASAVPETPESAQDLALRKANLARLTERVNELERVSRELNQGVTALEKEAKLPRPSPAQGGSLRTHRQRLEEAAREAESKASELTHELQNAELESSPAGQ